LTLISSVVLAGIQTGSINNFNFTQIVVLAFESLLAHRELPSSALREAIKLLLVVDSVQKGQVIKIIASSEDLLEAIKAIFHLGYTSGFVYYLIGKLLGEA
jgi:hypothetical protein